MRGLNDLAARLRAKARPSRRSAGARASQPDDGTLTNDSMSVSQRHSQADPAVASSACEASPVHQVKAAAVAKAQQAGERSWMRRASWPAPSSNPHPNARHCRFTVSTHKLGSGAYGSVMLGTDLSTGKPVAIKFIADGRMKPASLEREVGVLRRLSGAGHPGLLRFHGHLSPAEVKAGEMLTEAQQPLARHLRECHALVLDLVRGGELFEYVLQRDGLDEATAGPMFAQLVLIVARAHGLGIAHRDLKLENVLLCGRDGDADAHRLALIDWGLAHQHALADGVPVAESLHSRCGSRSYMAPEVTTKEIASKEGYSGFAADVWSLGVCLFAMHFGFFPFEQANTEYDWRARHVTAAQRDGQSAMATILGFYPDRADTAHPWSAELLHLLDRMLVFNPAKRATLDEVLRSPWVSRYRAAAEAMAVAGGEASHVPPSYGRDLHPTPPPTPAAATGQARSGQAFAAGSLERIARGAWNNEETTAEAPEVERQDSNSTAHSDATATSAGSSVVHSNANLLELRTSVFRRNGDGDAPQHPSHWEAVRYAIAGARQQQRMQQMQRRQKGDKGGGAAEESPEHHRYAAVLRAMCRTPSRRSHLTPSRRAHQRPRAFA